MNWDTAPQELDALRAQVVALTQERDHYKAMDALHIESLALKSEQLAEAQAHIAQLREALERIQMVWDGYANSDTYSPYLIATEALALPTDTAALDARLAQEALRVRRECIKDQQALLAAERERCAVVAEKSEWIAAQIRSMT